MEGELPLCLRCARAQKTCCQTREIYITLGDVQRIAEFTGRSEFYEFRVPDNPEYLDQDDDPFWRDHVFRADDSRRVLEREPEGDCTFLGDQGCMLPVEVRPLVCRMYPYDYDEHGLKEDLSQGCPLHLLTTGETLLRALDMHVSDVRRWHRQLYAELCLEKTADAHRVDV